MIVAEINQETIDKVNNLEMKTRILNKALKDFIQARDEFKTK